MKHDTRLHRYVADLRRSMGSKLFWLNLVPLDELATIVDFGCADGSMLKAIDPALPDDCIKIGVELDNGLRRMARANYVEGDLWTASLSDAYDHLADMPQGRKSCLILSSVLHEVDDVEELWDEIERMRFDYIVGRDMACSKFLYRKPLSSEWLKARASLPPDEWAIMCDVRDRHHSEEVPIVPSVASHLHGLLKLVHKQDYSMEAHENYFRMTSEEYHALFISGAYFPLSFAGTVTPYFKRFANERGFDFKDCPPFPITTHFECVLARRDSL